MRSEHRAEDYFAGVLEGEDRARFERHLEDCESCREELEHLRGLDARLSRGLTLSAADREPRQEWIEQVKASLPARRRRVSRWLLLGGVPAAATVATIVLLFVFQPWRAEPVPEDTLAKAYAATVAQSFGGTMTIWDGAEVIATGTFSHAPDDRWAVSLEGPSGQVVEVIQVGDQLWQRKSPNGDWGQLTRGEPLLLLPHGVGALDHVPKLLEGVTTLSGQEVVGPDSYKGTDTQYAMRLVRDAPPDLSLPNAWLMDHPPVVEMSLSDEGTLQRLKFVIQAPGDRAPLAVDLQFEDYGTQTRIEPPQQ